MTKRKAPTEVLSIKDHALAFPDADVTSMVGDIQASIGRRHNQEQAWGLSLTGSTSWEKAAAMVAKNEVALARTFLAFDITPSSVFERQAVEGKMFNAKAIKKIVEIAKFVCGMPGKLERVTKAFIACALLADDQNKGAAITNSLNQRFLNSKDIGSFITDKDVLDHIQDQRHSAMSTGADTQSSQTRNVLDVLGLGSIAKVERERDAIVLKSDHAFYSMFRAAVMA